MTLQFAEVDLREIMEFEDLSGYKVQEMPLSDWTTRVNVIEAYDLNKGKYRFSEGSSSVNVGEVKAVENDPIFTVGSYSCYAGVALIDNHLNVFHFREHMPVSETNMDIENIKSGIYGRAFEHKKSGHWVEAVNLHQLPPKAFKNLNLLVDPVNKLILYSYGDHTFIENYEP